MNPANERVLCVDDQTEIIDLLERHLSDSFDCVYATSGAEAAELHRAVAGTPGSLPQQAAELECAVRSLQSRWMQIQDLA